MSLAHVAFALLVFVAAPVAYNATVSTRASLRRRSKGIEEAVDVDLGFRDVRRGDAQASRFGFRPTLVVACVGAAVFVVLSALLAFQTEWFSGAQFPVASSGQCAKDSEVDPRVNLMLGGLYGPVGPSYWAGTRPDRLLPNITVRSEVAEELFHQGLIHLYGFNRVEARRNFKTASILDPSCCMCFWGLASSYIASINEPDLVPEERALGRQAIQEATKLLQEAPIQEGYSTVESGFVRALTAYYGSGHNDTMWIEESSTTWLNRYIEALRDLCQEELEMHPTCASLLAENLMKVTSWDYYTIPAGSPHELRATSIKPTAREASDLLVAVLDENERHPLACHLWVHLMESTDEANRAEKAADALLAWPTGVSHLVHMSGHIYHRVGRYEDSIRAGLIAIESDRKLASDCLTPYAPGHNTALMQASAMLIGDANLALAHATKVADHPVEYSQVLPGLFPLPRELVWAKFAMWNDAMALAAEGGPDQTFASKFAQAVSEYASALALASKGEATDARAALRRLKDTAAAIEPGHFPKGHPWYGSYQEMGTIMVCITQAKLDLLEGLPQNAIKNLEEAARLQHDMPYMEPEVFYTPVKPCLGAVLEQEGETEKARLVLEEDLIEHPNSLQMCCELGLRCK